MSEGCFNPTVNRGKLCCKMFEEYEIPAFYLQAQEVLSMYSSGKTTGLVIGSGEQVTDIVSVFEGYRIYDSCHRLGLGGFNLTNFMIRN
mmetsp:Transcript_24589/g.21820  ORF Transcript_24589/g.21820 Transcript_24589/m.21820 type:complete len:89 (+) Transcript_24589:323-589(+)